MKDKAKVYVKSVISNLNTTRKNRIRIEKDLYNHIQESCQFKDIDTVLLDMGDPKEVANDFMDGIIANNPNVKCTNSYYEYISKKTLFGLPLVHVKVRRGPFQKLTKAKGIIAIGDVAIGILFGSGLFSTGLFSFGLISLGILAMGCLSIGIFSAGAIAIGVYAAGAIAVGIETIGALAISKNIAIGAASFGEVTVGDHSAGIHALQGQNFSFKEVYEFLKSTETGSSSLIFKIMGLFY